jgi:glycosyltransferase involved in cell wall biosynthesis
MYKHSIIIPTRNEEKYIAGCLNSLINNDYPNEFLEILVVDGMSTDKTRDIVNSFSETLSFIHVLDNPKKTAPQAFNIGILNSSGDFISIISAHSEYPKNYFNLLTERHKNMKADNVGGLINTDVKNKTPKSVAIKKVLSNKFGVGNALFRTGVKIVSEVDTVAFGCYRKEVFDKFGLFDERLIRNQDIEFNKRIIKMGGKIILDPEIICIYYAREDYKSLSLNNYSNGLWNLLTVFYTKDFKSLSVRHFIPLVFLLSILLPVLFFWIWFPLIWLAACSLSCYCTALSIVSISINDKETRFQNVLYAFLCLHFSYAIGSLIGIFKVIGLWFMKKTEKKNNV